MVGYQGQKLILRRTCTVSPVTGPPSARDFNANGGKTFPMKMRSNIEMAEIKK